MYLEHLYGTSGAGVCLRERERERQREVLKKKTPSRMRDLWCRGERGERRGKKIVRDNKACE
jgi:hypothetical protein